MFLKELVGERVTIELSKEELVKLRILLGKLKALKEVLYIALLELLNMR